MCAARESDRAAERASEGESVGVTESGPMDNASGAAAVCAGGAAVCAASGAAAVRMRRSVAIDLPRRSCTEWPLELLPPEMWWIILGFIDQPTVDDYRKCATIWVAMRRQGTPMPMPTVLMSDQSLLKNGHFAHLARRLISPQMVTCDSPWKDHPDHFKGPFLAVARKTGDPALIRRAFCNTEANVQWSELKYGAGSADSTELILRHVLDNDPVFEEPNSTLFNESMDVVAKLAGELGKLDLIHRCLALLREVPKATAKSACCRMVVGAAEARKLEVLEGVSDSEVTGEHPIIPWTASDLTAAELLLLTACSGDVPATIQCANDLAQAYPDLTPSELYDRSQLLAIRHGMKDMLLALGWNCNYCTPWSGPWPPSSMLWLVTNDEENIKEVERRIWELEPENIRDLLSDVALDVANCFGGAACNGALGAMATIWRWTRQNCRGRCEAVLAEGLERAAAGGRPNAMQLCLDWGGEVNARTLEIACSADFDNPAAVRLVLACGSFTEEEIRNALVQMPRLNWVPYNSHVETVRTLLRHLGVADMDQDEEWRMLYVEESRRLIRAREAQHPERYENARTYWYDVDLRRQLEEEE